MSADFMALFFQFSYNPSTPIPALMIGENLFDQLLSLSLLNGWFVAISSLVTIVSCPTQA
jgi:hypothetical protein